MPISYKFWCGKMLSDWDDKAQREVNSAFLSQEPSIETLEFCTRK